MSIFIPINSLSKVSRGMHNSLNDTSKFETAIMFAVSPFIDMDVLLH